MNVVVRRADGGPVSLLVDEIGDVIDVDDGAFEPPPGHGRRPTVRELVARRLQARRPPAARCSTPTGPSVGPSAA